MDYGQIKFIFVSGWLSFVLTPWLSSQLWFLDSINSSPLGVRWQKIQMGCIFEEVFEPSHLVMRGRQNIDCWIMQLFWIMSSYLLRYVFRAFKDEKNQQLYRQKGWMNFTFSNWVWWILLEVLNCLQAKQSDIRLNLQNRNQKIIFIQVTND